MKTFTRGGVTLRYPPDWAFDVEDDRTAWSATVQSSQTAFVLVALRPDAAGPGELVDEALAALRSEYRELDSEPVVESVSGQPAVGYDVDFLSVDMSVVCLLRGLNTLDGPLLLMAQVSEYDRERNEPRLREVIASVQIEEE
jgi:hypothetical protein